MGEIEFPKGRGETWGEAKGEAKGEAWEEVREKIPGTPGTALVLVLAKTFLVGPAPWLRPIG